MVGIAGIMMFLVAMGVTAGCKNRSSQSAAGNSNQAVQNTIPLVQADSPEHSLTQAQINQAESKADWNAFQKALDEMIGKLPKPGQELPETPAVSASEVLALCDMYLAKQEASEQDLQNSRQQRLAAAEKQLQDAISRAGQSNAPQAKAAPELLLGTLYLTQAREQVDRLRGKEFQCQNIRSMLANDLTGIANEDSFSKGVEGYLPSQSIVAVESRLAGAPAQTLEPASLNDQLATAEKSAAELEQQKVQMEQQIRELREKSSQMHLQYLAVLEQAEKAEADRKYDLLNQAYAIRGGTGANGGMKGVIDYEAEAEGIEQSLKNVTGLLNYWQLRRQQLTETIHSVKQQSEELKNSPAIAEVQKIQEESRQRRQAHVNDFVKNLDWLADAEQDYAKIRLEAVTAYDKSSASFGRAAAAARETAQHANELKRLADLEKASLWKEDQNHYTSQADSLTSIPLIPEVSQRIQAMAGDFRGLAQQAGQEAKTILDQYPLEKKTEGQ